MPEPVIEERARARIGTTLNGKYRLDGLLGVGGMATVYAATHRNNKRVAVKVLHAELSAHPGLRTRFMREGYLANTVDHPGAVAVLDDDVAEDGAAFLVMELLEGESLAEACDRHGGKLPLRAVLAMAVQVLDVLASADAKNVVHRDIKPPNLFVTRTGQMKVLDFGVARMREAGVEFATHSGLALGTPAFMAPEQALGRTEEVDGLTDVWAVGATMFALLTGGPVHEASTPQEQMVFSATRSARSLGALLPELPAAVIELVDRALSFHRTTRWQGAAEMRDAARDAYRGEFGEDPSPAALVFMASPEKVPVSGEPPVPSRTARSPMASTVPETPISGEGARIEPILRAAGPVASTAPPSATSLVPTSSQPITRAGGRVTFAAGAVALVAAGIAIGAWTATRGHDVDGGGARTTSTSPASAAHAIAIGVPATPTTTAGADPAAATTTTAVPVAIPATATTSAPSPGVPQTGRFRPVRLPSPGQPIAPPPGSTASAVPAPAPSASVDRFDHQ